MKRIFNTYILSFLAICLLLSCMLTFLNSCKKDDESSVIDSGKDPLQPASDITTTIAGIVLDENGIPLTNVQVEIHGKTITTNTDGNFILPNISVPGNRCVISCTKAGYFTSLRAELPIKDKVTSTRIRMMSSTTTHTINAATGGKASLANGSVVDIPANSLVTPSGSSYSGQVSMSVRYMDPTVPGFGEFVPGGDLLARRTDESTTMLYSYGILRVKLTGSSGENLQITPGKNALLTMDIADEQLSTAPTTIPLWYFDEETGAWQEDGVATKQGDTYIGTVSHFTDWNCDDPKETATIIGQLVDCQNKPMYGNVQFGQTSSEIEASTQSDGSKQGNFSQRVPADIPTMVIIYRPFLVNPNPADIKGSAMLLVPVPPLKPGQVYDVGTLQPFPCPNTAEGTFKTKSGDQVEQVSFKVVDGGPNEGISGGIQNVYNLGQIFSISAFPAKATFSMTARTTSGITTTKLFQTTAAGETVDLGEIDLTGNVSLITVSGIISCQDTPVSGASVKAEWASGSTTVATNTSGVYGFSVPANQAVVLTITHTQGIITKNFQTPAGGSHQVGVTDICAPTATAGENSFTINGDIYSNALKVITVQPFPTSYASFDRDKNLTTVAVISNPDTLGFSLVFQGKPIGQTTQTTATGGRIWRKSGNKTINYYAGMGIGDASTTAHITVTKYDTVNGLVVGTFSGTYIGDNGKTITITNGKFSVIRNKDFSINECQGVCL
ncbi:carboxypeptidase regulatory-like domain-containing protein [Rhodocytophaga rosea]|uniref:Carboxypeptidase regulatory-like domain-containing protein n=1 Tax=Rhodocytophaga rosea TaxID=2704465 RepID=A0A6C0GBK0_9BACT|nr:carboxypeptidase-like regulatory domain-containing protein [Rhodocytophaga rosea]QHT65224.1 carboxypeptidase regulatory-like domain-containing protein [Rhodocytophaga rosea]